MKKSQVELMRINLKVEALICSLFKYKWLPTLSIRSIIRSAHACDVILGARRRAFLSQHSRSRRDVTRLSNKRSPYLFGVATANRTKVTTPNKYGAEIIARMSDWENSWRQPLRGEPGTSLNSAQSYVFLLRDWFNIFQLSLKTSWCSYMIIFSVAYR